MSTLDDRVYQALVSALLLGSLPPGTQLVETRIAKLFGVSRERVRKVLQRLGNERLIEVIARRGAFVSRPSLSQAREIYEARRIVEGGVAARLAGRLTNAQEGLLRDHARLEAAANAGGDRALSLQLAGEFHHLLASFCANAFVTRELQELISRIVMLEACFVTEPGVASACACEEHDAITQAIIAGDGAAAANAMHNHLSMVESRLQPNKVQRQDIDADAILLSGWERLRRERPGTESVKKSEAGTPGESESKNAGIGNGR
jgi:DNA-binding GntR family transcriptional regulator